MCAWKRGVQNNLPGQIRLGHIKEYQNLAEANTNAIKTSLKILDFETFKGYDLYSQYSSSPMALLCLPSDLSEDVRIFLQNSSKIQLNSQDILYLHSHKFPHSIIACIFHNDIPDGSILLKDYQLMNCKVCIGDLVEFTVYQGEPFTYDTREGAIGDTKLRYKPLSSVQRMQIVVTPRNALSIEGDIELDAAEISRRIAKVFFECIISINEVYIFSVSDLSFISRIEVIISDTDEAQLNDETAISFPDCYRGIVDASTEVYVTSAHPRVRFTNQKQFQSQLAMSNVVHILTSDYEVFPVKKQLLRPCLSLTFIVQSGKGKYADSSIVSSNMNHTDSYCYCTPDERDHLRDIVDEEYISKEMIKVDVDACTFDRVLLYLEHEARHEQFHFDPLLVNDLYDAACKLKLNGLKTLCEKVLGSFQERVRRTPIRYEEIVNRNHEGKIESEQHSMHRKKRKDTLLIMSGMVFDITNWLDEHPGGSTIIPEQALNVDSTVFFEIYHASRQSFLYLKEFYIGELAKEDIDKIPLPRNCPHGTKASEAFLEQLRRITEPWRLKPTDIQEFVAQHKSF